jgi:hypothetical protein
MQTLKEQNHHKLSPTEVDIGMMSNGKFRRYIIIAGWVARDGDQATRLEQK